MKLFYYARDLTTNLGSRQQRIWNLWEVNGWSWSIYWEYICTLGVKGIQISDNDEFHKRTNTYSICVMSFPRRQDELCNLYSINNVENKIKHVVTKMFDIIFIWLQYLLQLLPWLFVYDLLCCEFV